MTYLTHKFPDLQYTTCVAVTSTCPHTCAQVWDINMESRPVEVYPVHDYLRSRLCSLYENDSIFDRFECGWNGDDSYPIVC